MSQKLDPREVKIKANEAAKLFHGIQWFHYEAQALELAGQQKEALEIYCRAKDLHDVHRLESELMPVNRQGRGSQELTTRERQIYELLLAGKSNKAISQQLVISERTVENHVSSVLDKLGVSSRVELMARSDRFKSSEPVS